MDELKYAQCQNISGNDQKTAEEIENPELRSDFSKTSCQVVSDSKLFNFISKLSYIFIILSCHFPCEILRNINSCFQLCKSGLEFEKDAKKWYKMYKKNRVFFCGSSGVKCDPIPTRHPFKTILQSLNTGPVTEAIKV